MPPSPYEHAHDDIDEDDVYDGPELDIDESTAEWVAEQARVQAAQRKAK